MKPQALETVDVNKVPFSHQDIEKVVNDFYRQVAKDELLKVPFGSVHDWPEHIARMTHFWWTRFGGSVYMQTEYNPPLKHFKAGFNSELLARWLELFKATTIADLNPPQSQLWGQIATRMGHALSMKNEFLKAQFQRV